MRLGLVISVLVLGACECATRVGEKKFACDSDAQCADGFRCAGGECVSEGSAGGRATAGGGVAGGSVSQAGGEGGGDAGGGTSGGGEAGGGTSGGGEAGGGTSGGVATGGGGTSGGVATAGGGTSGGVATAGGGTAGGAVNPPTSLAFITSPPAPLLAGTCFIATVQARIGLVATPVASDTMVGLTQSLVLGARFYSDASCTLTTPTATIPGGATNGTFYVKPLTGLLMTITAMAPFGVATQSFTPRPIVRRGTCDYDPVNLPDGGVTPDFQNECAISPDHTNLTKTFLLTSTSASTSSSGAVMSRCWLLDLNTVRCRRGRGTSAPDNHWQTVELPQGLTVNHLNGTCPASGATNISWVTAVNPASSFVLATSENSGSAFDDEESFTVRLTGATSAYFEADGCDDYSVQVVDFAGVAVTRGVIDAGFPAGMASLTVSNLPVSSANPTVLVQARTSLAGLTNGECALLVRGDLPSNSSIAISRGAGNAGCLADPVDQIVWERIDFGTRANVQKLTATVPAGQTVFDVSISNVDTTRTVVFSSSQVLNGQGTAEIPLQEIDEAALRLELQAADNVRIYRGDQDESATVTFFVVEIEP